MSHALIIVDMLADFVRPGAALFVPGSPEIVPAIQQELAAARQAGDLVIYVCDAHDPEDKEFERFPPHAVAGSSGAEVIDELAPRPGEAVVEKRRYSPFFDTELGQVLADAGISRATVVGVCTHICVMETVGGLANRDFRVRVPAAAVADFDPGQARAALARMQSLFGAEVC
ncbi:MAG: cysteine hydrolase [Desulfarculaceae bacterium]|nr:cysteine hydrolase [Desulfarculaceae bacterium]MCF8071210.1 cysteine hydrolase [Desulfarculaceae bacterium]MCF8101187.1 cysteine hydrolase [Desulfarculaceae bacterium]MCF8115264.1 cysteine hydrolase [Desulfarculaceae bacterium]